MISKEDLYKLIIYFIAALTATVIRFIRSEKKSFPIFMVEMLVGASFAFFLIPVLVEHFHLSLYWGTALTWLSTMFSESVLKRIEKKLIKKIDDVTDTIN